MKTETQLKIQAYLDGELPEAQRSEVEFLLARDAEARGLLAEMQNTDAAFAAFESQIKLPESREFYWSKIEREITRQPVQPRETPPSPAIWLRRLLIPTAACAAVVIAAIIALPQLGLGGYAGETISDSDDNSVFTYHDYDSGATLVWLDYPAENDFADLETDDTLELN